METGEPELAHAAEVLRVGLDELFVKLKAFEIALTDLELDCKQLRQVLELIEKKLAQFIDDYRSYTL